MSGERELVVDLVIIIVAATSGGVLASFLRLPAILGYLVAGLVVGNYIPGWDVDVEGVRVIAELGVALLLFTLGIQFSFSKLADVRRVAVIGASAQMILTIGLGFAIAVPLGLSPQEAFVLGAAMALSSTMVALKLFDTRAELDTLYGHFLVYGVNDGLLNAIDFSDVRMDSFQLMAEAREHGAIAVPAHPGRPRVGLCEFIKNGVEFPDVGIVETANGGSRKGENESAQELAHQQGYLGIGGSDAHLVSSIAAYMTSFPAGIRNEGQLVEALLSGEFEPVTLEETASGP